MPDPVKELCKRKQRLYNKSKKTRNQDGWQEFCDIRKMYINSYALPGYLILISQFLTTSITPSSSAVVSCGWTKASACRLQITLSCAVICHIVSLQYLSRSSLHRLAGLPCRLFLSYWVSLKHLIKSLIKDVFKN